MEKNSISNFSQLNEFLGEILANFTSSLRFSCSSNLNYRKICTNLLPFTSHKYFFIGCPIQDETIQTKFGTLIRNEVFNLNNLSVCVKKNPNLRTKWIGNYFIFRGDWSNLYVDYQLSKAFRKKCYRRYHTN